MKPAIGFSSSGKGSQTGLLNLRTNMVLSVNTAFFTALGGVVMLKITVSWSTCFGLDLYFWLCWLCEVFADVTEPSTVIAVLTLAAPFRAGLGGSVGCAVRLETRRLRVQPPPRSATFFRGDWSWNIFYGHSLPSANSRRAVVSFWRKNVHNTG